MFDLGGDVDIMGDSLSVYFRTSQDVVSAW